MGKPRKSSQSAGRTAPGTARHAFKTAGADQRAFRAAGSSGATEAWMIPTRIVKASAGLLLLPVCWVASKTFFEEFSQAGIRHHFWTTDEFYFFALGAVYWVIAFLGLPRPLVVYVFGHELTHALWVWLQGGRVSAFKVGPEGGYIIADRRDFLVSLAPYFFPLYSIVVIALYAAIDWYYPDAWFYRRWLFAALGLTWAFHISFTVWMIPKRQTDLLLHGTFFSLVVIYLANLAVLTVGLVVACPQVSWARLGRHFVANAADWFQWFCDLVGWQPPPLW